MTCEQAEQFWDSNLYREESHGIKKFSESIFPFCHASNGLSGEFETVARAPDSWEPATCHPAVPTNLFHFWWLFLLQPAGLGMGDTVGHCGTVKVNSGIFESTNVLIDLPPAAPNFSAVCFAALSASQFPRVCGVSSFW